MYPQGGFRNPYSIYGIGDRSQTGRQPSRASIPISQPEPEPQPQPQPQSQQQPQQQQVPKPEARKEEPPKPTQPARQLSKPEPQVPKQYQQKNTATEPKRESPIPAPPPPATAAVKQPPPPPPQPVNLSPSENNKNEQLSIVPADQGKAIVKGSSPEPDKSLQQGIKEDITNLTRRLAELHAQHKLLNADQKQKGQAEMGVGVITLAGENRGATMDLGPDSRKIESFGFQGKGHKVGQDDKNEEKQDAKGKGSRHSSKAGPVNAYVNSNVQAANNSILYNSTCPHRDPGVRLALSNNPVHAKEITPPPSKESRPKATKNSAA